VYSLAADFTPTEKISGISGDDIWHLADFQGFWIGSNGTNIIYLDHGTIAAANVPPTWTKGTSFTNVDMTVPGCSTYCNYMGQLIGGGVISSWYSLGINDVIWSNIGSVDCTPSKKNEAGFMKMPWEGIVQKVIRLDNKVMVYGYDGIASLIPKERYLGLAEFSSIPGIPGRSCVGGNKDRHVLVDNEGYVWSITPKEINRLGYKEFMNTMTLANVIVDYDLNNDEFYISDGTKNYLLNKFGMCETKQFPSSIFTVGGTSYGTVVEEAAGTKDEARIYSNILDLGLAGIKTLTSVNYGIRDVTGTLTASAYSKYDLSSGFVLNPMKVVNKEGVWFGPVSGTELKTVLKSDNYSDFRLDYIAINYKVSDKRYVRGAYITDADKTNR